MPSEFRFNTGHFPSEWEVAKNKAQGSYQNSSWAQLLLKYLRIVRI